MGGVQADRRRRADVRARIGRPRRVRALVVGRAATRAQLEPELARLGIPFEWVTNANAASRECKTHRFEAAMVDAGLANLPQVLRAIDLRGRRMARSVVVYSTGE